MAQQYYLDGKEISQAGYDALGGTGQGPQQVNTGYTYNGINLSEQQYNQIKMLKQLYDAGMVGGKEAQQNALSIIGTGEQSYNNSLSQYYMDEIRKQEEASNQAFRDSGAGNAQLQAERAVEYKQATGELGGNNENWFEKIARSPFSPTGNLRLLSQYSFGNKKDAIADYYNRLPAIGQNILRSPSDAILKNQGYEGGVDNYINQFYN